MARPTDTERGAKIALGIAVMRATQPDLFKDTPDETFWLEIAVHAHEQLEECQALRQVHS